MKRSPAKHSRQNGLGLVEIMVGLVIGMISMLVIFQTVSTAGRRAATTTSGGDAQTSGTLGMYYLERHLRQVGWGFAAMDSISASAADAVNCDVGTFNLRPVEITQGATGTPDTVTATYGNATAFTGAGAYTAVGSIVTTRQKPGFHNGDRPLLVNGTSCQLMGPLTAVAASGNLLTVSAAATSSSGTIYNLGAAPMRAEWRINAGGLEFREFDWATGAYPVAANQVADDVVNMQAAYFVGGACTEVAPANWRTVQGICVALLLRSKHFDPNFTAAAPAWALANFTVPNLDGSAASCNATPNPNDWCRYRYEVFEKIIPFRNVIWGST